MFLLHLFKNESKRGISPLVTTILLVVVSVTLIIGVVSWSNAFTKDKLELSEVVDYKPSDLEGYISSQSVYESSTGEMSKVLLENSNGLKDLVITSYKILDTDPTVSQFVDTKYDLSTSITIEKGSGRSQIPIKCIPSKKFDLELYTSDNKYVKVPVTYLGAHLDSCNNAPYCGNSVCDADEDNASCSADCIQASILSPTSSTFAKDTDISFSSNIDSVSGTNTCSWTANSSVISSSCDNFNHSFSDANTYDINLSVSGTVGTSSDAVSITVKDNLVPSIDSPADGSSFDEGTSINFIGSATNTSGSYTCSWDSNIDGSLGSSCNFNSSILSVGTHLVTLSVTDDLQTLTSTINISIIPPPPPYVYYPSGQTNTILYIHTTDRSSTADWDTAMSYCDTLDSLGYNDWYLANKYQLEEIWNACPKPSKYTSCVNDNIQNKITGWVDFVSDYYWTSNEYSSSYAYDFSMNSGNSSYYNKSGSFNVRCVRDP